MDKFIGKRLDARYEIREIIGVGGMAVVYKAYDCIDDRIVAIKILKEEFVRNSEFLNRFRNESKAIAVLSHPNIVKVYDVSFGDNFQYIVMEYIDGITLKEYMQRTGAINWKDALYFSMQTLHALQHAHDKGIVHRDVKPQNIMLLSDGTIKVTDFGIARFARSNQQTLTDKAIGSVHYISPEQARGDIIDEKADLYSVGVMMYEMLTGTLPFDGDTAVSVALMHMQNEPQPPRQINPSIPVGLEQIILRAMKKNPALRYHSDAEMLRDLEQVRRDPTVKFYYNEIDYNDADSTKYIDNVRNVSVSQSETGRSIDGDAIEKVDLLFDDGKKKKKNKDDEDDYEVLENDDDSDEQHKSIVPVLAGIAAVVLIVVVGLVSWFLVDYFNTGSGKSEKCPELIGMNYDDAVEKYPSLNIVIKSYDNSDKYSAKTIMSQSKDAGKFLEKDLTIEVVVSLGKKKIQVPNVYNKTEAQAKSTFDSSGIEYTVKYENHASIEEGHVIRTDPKRGESITKDKIVKIFVSSGPETVYTTVPDITGISRSEAAAKLQSSGLKLGSVTEVSNSMTKGYVVSQSIKAGNQAAVNSSVNITISTGSADNDEVYTVSITVDKPDDYYTDLYEISASLGTAVRTSNTPQDKYNFSFETSQDEGTIKVFVDSHLYQQWSFKRGSSPTLKKKYSLSEYTG